jgi:hypothetical protein
MTLEAPRSSGDHPAHEAVFSKREGWDFCEGKSQMQRMMNQGCPLLKRIIVLQLGDKEETF